MLVGNMGSHVTRVLYNKMVSWLGLGFGLGLELGLGSRACCTTRW